jgi:predicted nucleotidyltransferase
MNKLNDNIWDKESKIIPEVRRKLLVIANKITNEISNQVKVKHIYFTGSLATYNWTPVSDIDLHIIVDIINKDCDEVSENYFDLMSKLFNKQHNIFIKGFKVEVNIKPFENFLKNKAVYDLGKDGWIKYPQKVTKEITDSEVIQLAKHYSDKIDNLILMNGSTQEASLLKKELKQLRQSGLETDDGEYSTQNLAFKSLRNSGHLLKLFTYYNDKEDKILSLESFSFKKHFNIF